MTHSFSLKITCIESHPVNKYHRYHQWAVLNDIRSFFYFNAISHEAIFDLVSDCNFIKLMLIFRYSNWITRSSKLNLPLCCSSKLCKRRSRCKLNSLFVQPWEGGIVWFSLQGLPNIGEEWGDEREGRIGGTGR